MPKQVGAAASQTTPPYHPARKPQYNMPLTIEEVKKIYQDSTDFVCRPCRIGGRAEPAATLCFIDGLVSGVGISESIMRSLAAVPDSEASEIPQLIDALAAGGVTNHVAPVRDNMDDVVSDLASGSAVLFIQGADKALAFEVKGFPVRGVSEPTDESVVKGAKDSFVESIRTNTGNVRRRIKNGRLVVHEKQVGRQTQTTVSLVYIDGLTNPDIVAEAQRRIDAIDTDAIIFSKHLEERLIDKKTSLFPQLIYTERCDRFCNSVLNGRVGVLCDGIPMGYMLPATFAELMKASEDVAGNLWVSTCVRIIRYVAFVIALALPGIYLALINYHHVMLPTDLAISIQGSKQDVPLPAIIEVLGMLFAFEVMLEAGLRLPKPVGQAMSILSALVVGQAAVEAKLISPAMVIVIALTGIAGFTIPNNDLAGAVRVWRLLLVVFGGIAGLFGVFFGIVILIYQMASLESYGVSFLAPLSLEDLTKFFKQAIWRKPVDADKTRDTALGTLNQRSKK